MENVTLNNELQFGWKKENLEKVAPRRFGVTLISAKGKNYQDKNKEMMVTRATAEISHVAIPGISKKTELRNRLQPTRLL